MGDDTWREADRWPPPATPVVYYLHPPSAGTNRGGIAADKPTGRQVTSFLSDPSKPVLNPYDSSGAHDYRQLAERSDVLIFDSAPMERDLEVTGPIGVKMFVSCDCRDLDLWVRLLDLAPDGTAFNLMSPGLDVQRASDRDLSKGRQLLRPGTIYELGPVSLMTSNVFQKGHQIRVQISGSFFPNFSRNLQNGELENNSGDLKKATITIYLDPGHASHIVLPVVPRSQ